jgi:hypothetical protein
MNLTADEILVILDALRHEYGFGYSEATKCGVSVGQLQSKLSVWLEVQSMRESKVAPKKEGAA